MEQQIALVSPKGDVIHAINQDMNYTKIEPFYLIFATRVQVEGELVGYIVSGKLLDRMPRISATP